MSIDYLSSPPGDSLPILGIDVSKLTLDTCLILRGKRIRQRFANSAEGHRQMLGDLQIQGISMALIVMEATGPYSLAVATAAFEASHQVAVINPRRMLDYARAKGRRNKTDRVDAALIADFAAAHAPALWQPSPPAQSLLRDLLRCQRILQSRVLSRRSVGTSVSYLLRLHLLLLVPLTFHFPEDGASSTSENRGRGKLTTGLESHTQCRRPAPRSFSP